MFVNFEGGNEMNTNAKRKYQRIIAVLTFIMIMVTSVPANAKEQSNINYFSRYITIDGREMHVVLYGDISQTGNEVSFTDGNKTTLVMLPALAVSSPHLYMKPIAEALDTDFNVVIIEPLGYGLSDMATTTRSMENINKELEEALEILGIDQCVLMVHSISGVYGLDFVLGDSDKVKGFISIDNTVYDEGLLDGLAMEQEYMLNIGKEFDELRNSFLTLEDFQLAITQDPEKYGATLPEITGYQYPESDMEEYIQAVSLSYNQSSISEIEQTDDALLKIKDKKFPDSLPVLMMISSNNVENVPAWEPGHRNQLNPASANHELYVLEGSHYIWFTNLTGIVEHVNTWKDKHQF